MQPNCSKILKISTIILMLTYSFIPRRALSPDRLQKRSNHPDSKLYKFSRPTRRQIPRESRTMAFNTHINPSRTIYTAIIFTTSTLAAVQPANAFSLTDAFASIQDTIAASGSAGILIFIIAYVIATIALIPASALTLAAGYLFGPVLGTAIVSVASTTGAAAAFFIGRTFARPFVAEKLGTNPKFAAVDQAITGNGAKITFLLRLSPIFPFSLLNYALSLTGVSFQDYVLASWAGMIPGTIAYVALGGAGKAATSGSLTPTQLAVYGLGVVGTLAATRVISNVAGDALKEAGAIDD
jgi:uncharacterized membrane protein YdjX (TVP38/TMEM64 family)